MATIRTIPPNSYLPPSQAEMRQKANDLGLKAFSPSLVEDVCNLIAGGDYSLQSEMLTNVEQSEFKLLKDSYGDYMYKGSCLKDDNNHYVKDFFIARRLVAKKEVKYHQRVQDFLRTLDLNNLPGGSPLEQAICLLKLLATQSELEGIPNSDDCETLPIFSEDDSNPESIAKKINEAIDTTESLDDIETDLLDPNDEKGFLEIAEDMMTGKKIMLEIKRELDKLVKLKTSKSIKLIPDPEGNEVKYRGMKELSEIDKLNPAEFIYPKRYQTYRRVTGEAQVRERCIREEKKMLLYIICDNSGSMSENNRFWRAGGVLMNRLSAVLRGEAEVFFSFFNESLCKENPATNLQEAGKLISSIKEKNFDGGGTEIASCTREAVKRINEKLAVNPHLTKPELLVITDGDDNTGSLTLTELAGIRLHTLVVGGDNRHIVTLAQRSGGVGIANL